MADTIRALPLDDRKIVGRDLLRLHIGCPMGPPLCKPLRPPIWELRSSLPSKREMRLLHRFDAETRQIVVGHAFIETTRTTPKSHLDLASSR